MTSTLQDHGFGLLPFGELHWQFHQNARQTAEPYIRQRELPLLRQVVDQGSSSIWAQWRGLMLPEERVATYQHRVYSFLKTWPTNFYTTLTDDDFRFACRLLLHRLEPKAFLCPLTNIQLATLAPQQYTEHFMSCVHCGASQFRLRHERVNNVLHKVLRYNAVTSTLNPKDLPLPDNDKGGPDLLVYTCDTADAVDVAVCRAGDDWTRKLKAVETRKMTSYQGFGMLTSYRIVPWAMNVLGEFGAAAHQAAKKWSHQSASSSTYSDLLTFSQMEMIRGIRNGYINLHARAAVGGREAVIDDPTLGAHVPEIEQPMENQRLNQDRTEEEELENDLFNYGADTVEPQENTE